MSPTGAGDAPDQLPGDGHTAALRTAALDAVTAYLTAAHPALNPQLIAGRAEGALARLDPLPTPGVPSAASYAMRASEDALADSTTTAPGPDGSPAMWRARLMRVTLVVLSALEGGSVDSSAMLGCIDDRQFTGPELELARWVESCVRAVRDLDLVLAFDQSLAAVWGELGDNFYRAAASWASHCRDIAVEATDIAGMWSDGRWRERYALLAPHLLGCVLRPDEVDEEYWAELFNAEDEDDLRYLYAIADDALTLLTPQDLAEAGVQPGAEPRTYTGLPGYDAVVG